MQDMTPGAAATAGASRWLGAGAMLALWALMLLFIIYPLGALLLRTVFEDGSFSPAPLLAAVQNPNNLRALRNSLVLALMVGFAGTLVGLVFAFTVERAGLGRRAAKLIDLATFLPLISPPFTTSIAFVFSFFYDPFTGLFNTLLQTVGLGRWTHAWLGESATAIYAVIAVSQWQSVGYVMMLFIVAIQGIPRDLYEAAELDGAGAVAQFLHITVPQVREMLIVATVVTVVGSITVFSEPYILTGGGPGDASTTLATYMYRSAFFRDEMGYAAAIAALIFVVSMLISLLQLRVFGKAR